MKKVILISMMILLGAFSAINAKGPVMIEVATKYDNVSDALLAAKKVLLLEKFIVQGEVGDKTFTAKRTTGATADYYVADVTAQRKGEKVNVEIQFIKMGTGLLNLQKVAGKIKKELEK